MRRRPARPANLLPAIAAVGLIALALGGCQTTASTETTGSLASPPAARTDADWRIEAETWGARYRENPRNVQAAMRYAQALRGIGQRTQAAAVLEQASIQNPHDRALLGAYGRALAEIGNYNQALEVLGRAHTPDQPDWRILSAQGAVLDQMGRHQEAQRYYASALKIMPDDPSVLSNLGLSYALMHDLPKAEETLRRAVARPGADPRVRQNLALVVGLEGRFAEAEKIASADLPPDEAAANIAYLRQMVARQSEPKKVSRRDPHPQPAGPQAAVPARTLTASAD
ncbi:MAG TPA: tetratricopeptide repeat protein [Xanthobacteraceae bacterium]|nr:tetratricopeptide repeat protein [Xanthobacteraceae bacterium]